VKVDELVGLSHTPVVLSGAQVLVESDEEVVSALRAFTTRFGIAKSIIDPILPIGSESGIGMRGPNLGISANFRTSMLGRKQILVNDQVW
jgi:hypothetical protein